MYIKIIEQQFYQHAKHIKGYSKATIKRYRYTIGFYSRFAGINTIDQVNEDNVRAFFLYGRSERNWKPNTFLIFYKSLNVFFRWCVAQKYLSNNPLSDIETPRLEHKLPAKLTKQDTLRLLEIVYNYPYEYRFLRYRNHAMFSLFVFAGLRKNELLNLKYADVDIENLTLFVRQGKGNKDRVVPMSYTLAHTLQAYIDERKRLRKTCAYFFTSMRLDMGFTENGLKHLVNNIRAASKIQFTIHQLRHTFATLMLEGGCDIYSLSKMMGHSDIKTTTIYLAASAEHLREQMDKHPLNQ